MERQRFLPRNYGDPEVSSYFLNDNAIGELREATVH